MRARLHGRCLLPAIVTVGVWDPFSARHSELVAQSVTRARSLGLQTLAVVLDPDPVSFLVGSDLAPPYDAPETRVRLLTSAGITTVLHVRFCASDLDRGARDLMALVGERTDIAELWLGSRQTLGRCEQGSSPTIDECGTQMGFSVHRFRAGMPDTSRTTAREALRAGRLGAAALAVGRTPTWHRPRGGALRLPWKPGSYQCVGIEDPITDACLRAGGVGTSAPVLSVSLEPVSRHVCSMAWPQESGEWLTFIAGPLDM